MQRGRASDQRADTKKPNRTEAIRRYRTTLPVRRHIRCLGQCLNDDRDRQLFRPIIGHRSFDTAVVQQPRSSVFLLLDLLEFNNFEIIRTRYR